MQTLLLDTVLWDLVLDVSGNIAVASTPYSEAQDAASNIKLFKGELYYNTTQGIPYLQDILGLTPSLPLTRAQYEAAALMVPDVATAQVFFSAIQDRSLSGQVQITSSTGATAAASF